MVFKEKIRYCARCKKRIIYSYEDYVVDFSKPKSEWYGKMLCRKCAEEVQ